MCRLDKAACFINIHNLFRARRQWRIEDTESLSIRCIRILTLISLLRACLPVIRNQLGATGKQDNLDEETCLSQGDKLDPTAFLAPPWLLCREAVCLIRSTSSST
mmetsp:Transcript_14487/g.49479  ORF Transcript_14487/g.49479 Transcript_14487/m.49479 type:complete len:105 (-) Transcript_14487:753-1067(-)